MTSPVLSLSVDKHITLKELELSDVLPVFTAIDNGRTYLSEWLPFVEKTKDAGFTLDFVESYLNSDRKDLTFAIYVEDEFAGLIGLKDSDLLNRKTEIGYWLSAQFQHRGIMTKSCFKLMEYCFDVLKLNRIQLKAGVGNNKSRAVAERLGFRFEGIEREGELLTHGFIDLAVYGILKSEFNNTNQGLTL